MFNSPVQQIKTQVMRTIKLPSPIVTRQIELNELVAADNFAAKFDFVGMTTDKVYSKEMYFEQNTMITHGILKTVAKSRWDP